jgi:hypothetical protein
MTALIEPAAWATAEWRASAVAWLDAKLTAAGLSRTGEAKQTRLRPWSTLLRAPTTGGDVWFKAACNGTAFEPALYGLLTRVTPEFVLAPLAIDPSRGWLLLPDGGPTLGEVEDDDALMADLAVLLPRYAEFQLRLAGSTEALFAAGVADMRPERLTERFEEALAYVGDYVARRGTENDRERFARVVQMRPQIARWAERLRGAPGPPSLDHNDLHWHNVFVDRSVPSLGLKLFDWGDAVVAHPFASMLVGLGVLVRMMKVRHDDPRVVRARDAYLEPFGSLASHRELVETLEVAVRASCVARTLVWARAVAHAAEDEPHSNHDGPMLGLFELLSEHYLGESV